MSYRPIRINGVVVAIERLDVSDAPRFIPILDGNPSYEEFKVWNQTNAIDLSDNTDQVARATDTLDLRTQYQNAVDRLTQIVNAVNPTNVQVIAAVKDLATIQLRVLKLLRWLA